MVLSLTFVKLPKMSKSEIKELVSEQNLCRIAFKGEKYPYMAPFQYVLIDGELYFHFTDYGKKMKLIENDNWVCVEIEKFKPDLSSYNFVIFTMDLCNFSLCLWRFLQIDCFDGSCGCVNDYVE